MEMILTQEKCLLSITEASKLFDIGQHGKFRKTDTKVLTSHLQIYVRAKNSVYSEADNNL